MKTDFIWRATGLLPLWLAGAMSGAIISGSVTGGSALTAGGIFVKLTPPLQNPFGPVDSVGNDNFQSPNLFGFDEQQNVVLTSPLTAEIGSSPLAAGTVVASHYVFFDPGPSLNVIGTVNFDANVLAICTSTTSLASSDFLAATGVNYLSTSLRGLEAGDSVTISGPRQILVSVAANSPGDYVRVLTAAAPGPQLAIVLVRTNVLVSWPTNPPGYNLQSATNLAPPVNWLAYTQTPGVVGQQFRITNAVSGSRKFFRLSKP